MTETTQWWLPWLPVVSSLAVAAVAFAGVLISNRTNREAIRAARVLDHHKWLRESLLRLGSEAAGHAFEIDRLYNKRSFEIADDRYLEHMLTVAGEIRRLSATADSLSIIGFPELAGKCGKIREAADRIVDPAHRHRTAVHTSAPREHTDTTRAAVDRELAALSAVREEFVALAEATLRMHALTEPEISPPGL
jgi:hypothetical protein